MKPLALVCAGIASLCGYAVAADTPRLVAPDARKHLVLDTRVIRSTENARLVLGTVTKEPRNPLFRADQPWENSLNNLYPNVLWDEQERVFKLWYKCVLADKDLIAKMDAPSTVHDVGWYLLYATSKDGLAWERPALGLHKFDGSAANNVVARDTPNVGVFKDPHDPDIARRYKMVYDVGLGKPRVRFSADGVHWGEPVEALGFSAYHGDTHNNAFWDDRLKKYLWFTKLYLGERLVARFESDDFIHWKNSGMVLRSSVDEGKSSQTYCLPVFRYGNIYLGYVMMYHVGRGRAVDCELAWSPDSVTWQRVAPGTPFIPRGPKGSHDSECIYAMAGPSVAQGNDLLIFYGGSDVPHLGWKRHCLPSLARLPLDRFAGYEPVEKTKPAILETGSFSVTDEPLRVSADATNGRLLVQLLDHEGSVLAEAEPLTANVTDAPVRWQRGNLESLKGKPVRFRFTLSNASLHALGGVELRDPALPEHPNPIRSRPPAPATTKLIAFDNDAQGWKGNDTLEHHASGGAKGGYVSVTRGNGLVPFVYSPATAKDSPLAGDWTQLIGGRGATISALVRAAKAGGKVKVELFAGDISQWGFESGPLGEAWTRAEANLRYDWTDAEAKAAGWIPSVSAFSWADTITHVGKIVITRTAGGEADRIDVDEVSVAGIE